MVVRTESAHEQLLIHALGERKPGPPFAEDFAPVHRVYDRRVRDKSRVNELQRRVHEHLQADWGQRGVFGSVGGPLSFDHFAPPS